MCNFSILKSGPLLGKSAASSVPSPPAGAVSFLCTAARKISRTSSSMLRPLRRARRWRRALTSFSILRTTNCAIVISRYHTWEPRSIPLPRCHPEGARPLRDGRPPALSSPSSIPAGSSLIASALTPCHFDRSPERQRRRVEKPAVHYPLHGTWKMTLVILKERALGATEGPLRSHPPPQSPRGALSSAAH